MAQHDLQRVFGRGGLLEHAITGFRPRPQQLEFAQAVQQAAGARIEPKPSLAWAIGSMRAPTAAAAPPLEPPEMREGSQGFFVVPCSCGSQVRLRPSSHVFVRPKITRPARLSRATCSLSAAGGGVSAKKREPRVMGTPAIEAVLQIAPFACRKAPTAACVQRNGPIRLVIRIDCQNSSVRASKSANGIGAVAAGVPALLKR